MQAGSIFNNKAGKSGVEIIRFIEGESPETSVVQYRALSNGREYTKLQSDFLRLYEAAPVEETGEGAGGTGLTLHKFNMLTKFQGGNTYIPVEKIATSEDQAKELISDDFEETVEEVLVIASSEWGSLDNTVNLSL